ncbi:FliH/SctL family protein [Dyella subtropica]|uniref:FliH/SctL family protein n=1 Tax=Dyella subtropica TaxID=2992127 RepID=UPI0022566B10|nr:FliH/SctL family protein [Dyella subtropica]
MGVMLTREEMADYLRWEPPQVGAMPASAAEPVAASAPPTVADLEALEREAHDEGYATGLAEGRAAATHELAAQQARLESLFASASRPLESLDDLTELELARLAMVVARRVVARELQLSPDLIVQTVRQAAMALPSATRRVRVYVNPSDLVLIRAQEATEAHWELHADPTLQPGDCRLESEHSRLDARVDVRLAAVIDAVLGDESADLYNELDGVVP